MPALNPRQLVINTIWTVLEARPAFAAAVKEANRIKTSDLLQLEREALGLQATGQFPRAYCTANAATVSAPPITFKFGSATATVDYAVPMDAATCCWMFSVELAREMSRRRSVCMAPENTGIIVAPMPTPWMNRRNSIHR